MNNPLQLKDPNDQECQKEITELYLEGYGDFIIDYIQQQREKKRGCSNTKGILIDNIHSIDDMQIIVYTDSNGYNWCFEKESVADLLKTKHNPWTNKKLPINFIKDLEKIPSVKSKTLHQGLKAIKSKGFEETVKPVQEPEKNYFGLESRTKTFEDLGDYLQKVDKKICLHASRKGQKTLVDFIDLGKFLGAGSFGSAYFSSVTLPVTNEHVDMVIKFAGVQRSVFTSIRKGFDKEHAWHLNGDLREIVAHLYINLLLENSISPNFIFMYNWFLCNICKDPTGKESIMYLKKKEKGQFVTKHIKTAQPCIIFALEKVDGDLNGLVKSANDENWDDKKRDSVFVPAIFQTIMALAVLQKYFGADHADAGLRNILWKKITTDSKNFYWNFFKGKTTDSYWTYIFDGQTYYVPNNGYMFFLGDYGKVLERPGRAFPSAGGLSTERIIYDQKLKGWYTRVYDANTETFKINIPQGGDINGVDPFYKRELFHTRDAGLLVLANEVHHIESPDIQKRLSPYLKNLFDVGIPLSELINVGGSKVPRIEYSTVFKFLFGKGSQTNYTVRPSGTELGIFNADKPLKPHFDEIAFETIREIY